MTSVLAGLLAGTLEAHGGQYRGPSGLHAPSDCRDGGSSVPPPISGPTNPPTGPSRPGTPSTQPVAAGSAAGAAGGARTAIGEDLSRWRYWWEFHKDPYIRLKAAVHDVDMVANSDRFYMGATPKLLGVDSLRPSTKQVQELVLPALKRTLDSTDQRDITSSCLVALAKIGTDHESFAILDEFRARLTSADQEIRETAALAMGISHRVEAIDDLVALFLDTQRGRALVGRSRVDVRTRAFAGHGLGLIAGANDSIPIKRRVLDGLSPVLGDEDQLDSSRDVKVAAISGIGALAVSGRNHAGRKLCGDALRVLDAYFRRPLGPAEQLIQSHVPTAVAALLEDADDDGARGYYAERFHDVLVGESSIHAGHTSLNVRQSAAMALGRLAGADPMAPRAKRISAALREAYARDKDKQTRYFALVTLGQIGGAENRAALLRELDAGTKALERPWAALGLGVLCHERMTRAGGDGRADAVVGEALRRQLRQNKNPESIAAFCVALGLTGYQPALDDLIALLKEYRHQDELAGYVCIGMGLLGDRRAIEPIRGVVLAAARRPLLLQQAAIALGKLGDKRAAEVLIGEMGEADQNLAKMSALASAIGLIGDRRSIEPLIRIMDDEARNDLTRAFAAVALGGVTDKDELPWNAQLASRVNYRGAVDTLTNQISGILDIL